MQLTRQHVNDNLHAMRIEVKNETDHGLQAMSQTISHARHTVQVFCTLPNNLQLRIIVCLLLNLDEDGIEPRCVSANTQSVRMR